MTPVTQFLSVVWEVPNLHAAFLVLNPYTQLLIQNLYLGISKDPRVNMSKPHQSTKLVRFLSYISVKSFILLYAIDTTVVHTTTFSRLNLCNVFLFDFPRPCVVSLFCSLFCCDHSMLPNEILSTWISFTPKIPSVPSQGYFWIKANITLKEFSVCILWPF